MIAAIFPGQGSQENGMGQSLYHSFSSAKDILDRAEATLPGLLDLMWNEREELKLTANTQPALLAVSVAAYAAYLEQNSTTPAYMAGHSLGEWSAHVAASTLTLEDALTLVRKRGQYMQEAVPVGVGGMAAVIKLSSQAVFEAVQGIEGVEVANFNSPEQTVISGTTAGIETASAVLKELKGRVVPLAVSAPFHSSLMQPAKLKLAEDLAKVTLSTPKVPVFSNVTAKLESDPATIGQLLLQQITSSVRWVDIQLALAEAGVSQLIEFGSGKVLCGLAGRTIAGVATRNIGQAADLTEGV